MARASIGSGHSERGAGVTISRGPGPKAPKPRLPPQTRPQRQPRMKSCKLSDVTRVTRVNRSSWGKVTPALYCYEIEARGKTFRLLAPRND